MKPLSNAGLVEVTVCGATESRFVQVTVSPVST
jgi:hypothetical protein